MNANANAEVTQTEDTATATTTSAEDRFFGVRTEIDDTPPAEDGKSAKEIEVEVIDDRPPEDQRPPASQQAGDDKDSDDPELKDYSKSVQKRINHLRWQAHEERRAKEASERMRDEAVRIAQGLSEQNRQYQDTINAGEARLVEQIKTRAALAVEKAQADYRKAYEEGDTDAVVRAQQEMIKAQAEQTEAARYEDDYMRRNASFMQQQQFEQQRQQHYYYPQQQQQQPAQQQQLPATELPEVAVKWADDNPWFNSDEHMDMTALAYGVHQDLVRNKGMKPDTEEYFGELDKVMRHRFPEYFGKKDAGRTSTQSTTVVAPGERNNGAKPRKIQLTSTQVALAKKLNVPLEVYAAEYATLRGLQNEQ